MNVAQMSQFGASTTGPSIRRNTIWNFAGVAAPVPVALIAIPLLIARLGQERFGLLTIAWAVMGYFSIFDFGLSRATIKYLAEACHDGDAARTRRLFWSSTAAHLVLGMTGGLILMLAAPTVAGTLDVGPLLRAETQVVLYLLAASVPLIVLTSVARGSLEAIHRFDLVNAVKLPASLIAYLGPLVVVAFTDRLPPVILVILASRVVVLLIYFVLSFRVLPSVRTFDTPRISTLGPLLTMGGWITVGTALTPVIVSIDRFVIGSVVSVAAVAVYAAPYEVVTRLWIFSVSLMGVLFPRFAMLTADPNQLHELYRRALGWLAVTATPIAVLMVAFAPEFFNAWLGSTIAQDGVAVAQWLTVGVLVNVIGQVPFTLLQATGHADVTGKLQLMELPLYAAATWGAALQWGVIGVAIAWTVRAAIDALAMFIAARVRLGPIHGSAVLMKGGLVICATMLLIVWCWHMVPMLASDLTAKTVIVCTSVAVFTYLTSRGLDISSSTMPS